MDVALASDQDVLRERWDCLEISGEIGRGGTEERGGRGEVGEGVVGRTDGGDAGRGDGRGDTRGGDRSLTKVGRWGFAAGRGDGSFARWRTCGGFAACGRVESFVRELAGRRSVIRRWSIRGRRRCRICFLFDNSQRWYFDYFLWSQSTVITNLSSLIW